MPQDHAPDEFDWVTAQSKCSAVAMFERLQMGIRDDVNRRNGLLARRDGWKYEFLSESADVFEVTRVTEGATARVSAAVRFERAGRRILVQGEDVDVDFTAVVALDVAGV